MSLLHYYYHPKNPTEHHIKSSRNRFQSKPKMMKKTKNRSPVWLAAAVVLTVVLCSSNFLPRCGAASAIDALTTTTQLLASAGGGGGGGYAGMAGADDDDEEFMMESGSSSHSLRMLQGGSRNVYNSINSGRPAYACGSAQHYCIGNGNDRKLYCDPRSRDPACHR